MAMNAGLLLTSLLDLTETEGRAKGRPEGV